MPFKIQLATASQVLNIKLDPEGSNSFALELKRSSKNDGVFYNFGIGLKFFKEGRRLIRDVYEEFGIDGEIEIRIFEFLPNSYSYEKIYTGQLRLKDYEIDEIGVTVNVEQVAVEREFLNKVKVDRTIPTDLIISIPPKTILQRLEGKPSNADVFTRNSAITFNFSSNSENQSRSATRYLMLDLGDREFSEFDSINEGGLSYVVSEFDAIPFLEILSGEQGVFNFNFELKNNFIINGVLLLGDDLDVGNSSTHTPPLTIKLFFERRNSSNISIQKTQIGSTYSSVVAGTFGNDEVIVPFAIRTYVENNVVVSAGERLYLYYEIELGSTNFDPAGEPVTVTYDISVSSDVGGVYTGYNVEARGLTQFPASNVQQTLAFELLDSIITQNTSGKMRLKSDFFGREDMTDYDVDGKGSLISITNGHKLRQSNAKLLFANWQDSFESFNAIYCLGWGFETDALGNKFVRVEEKAFFFDSSAITLNVIGSAGLVKRVKQDILYSRVEVGYPDFENLGAANTVDEFNTRRKYNSAIGQADNELKLLSVFRASSYEIESERRQTNNTITNKLDDENFFIALKRLLINLYGVETGADYTSIQNIFDPATAYNIRLRPTEFIENWRPVLSGCLLRSADKSYEFNFGSLNYDFIVDGLREDRDIIMSDGDALWFCDEIEFETGITTNERSLITNNPTQLISVNDWAGNNILGFLLETSVILEDKKGTFILLKANAQKVGTEITKIKE